MGLRARRQRAISEYQVPSPDGHARPESVGEAELWEAVLTKHRRCGGWLSETELCT